MEGILPSPAEAETEEEMFTMPTIDMVATGRNTRRVPTMRIPWGHMDWQIYIMLS